VIIVAIVYVAWKDRFGQTFDAAQKKMTRQPGHRREDRGLHPAAAQFWAYGTLALGSAMALFMYPHSITAVLSSKSRTVIRRNAAILRRTPCCSG